MKELAFYDMQTYCKFILFVGQCPVWRMNMEGSNKGCPGEINPLMCNYKT